MGKGVERWIAWVEVKGLADFAEPMASVLKILERHSPLVEYGPPSGFYLDLSGWRRSRPHPREVLDDLSGEFRRAGINFRAGLGPNKLLARAAAEVALPGGSFWLLEQGQRDLLEGLPVESWPELGHSRLRRLREMGISRIHDFSRVSPCWIRMVFKKRGEFLLEQSRGRDPRPVVRRLPRLLDDMMASSPLSPPSISAEKSRPRSPRSLLVSLRTSPRRRRARARPPALS